MIESKMLMVRNEAAASTQRLAAFLLAAVVGCAVSASHAQLRLVNYNIAQLRGNPTNLQNVLIALHQDDKPGFAVPVSVFVFQEVRSTDINALQAIINAAAPSGVTYTKGTYTTSASEDNSGGAQAIFYRSGLLIEQVSAHQDIFTQGGRNTDRWLIRLNGYNSIFAWVYVYGSHLKADTGSANEADRLAGVNAIRNNADLLGANFNIIYSGDMNFYNNGETGYQRFFDPGNGQAVDPLGNGPWNGSANPPNNANNWKHTQSPLLTAVNGLVGGGMNSRFDLQISSNALHDDMGLAMMFNTYRALGNDGLHYNQAIDTGNNFYYPGQLARSNALATNLRLASDHIPLVADYQIPAMMAGSIPANYGRVIVSTPFGVAIEVTNPAPVEFVFGADVLSYTANATLNLSGSFSDTVEALGDVSNPSFPLNTATAGIKNGTVTLSSASQGVQPTSPIVLNTSGTVVRSSNPSFSNSSAITKTTVSQNYDANTGTHNFSVNVYNFGFDALQATLDIDSLSALNSPFAYLGGASDNIGATPATLNFSFDTTGLSSGPYIAPVTINTSDEDIPGEGLAALNLTISIVINGSAPCPADITGDMLVNVNDLLAVINAWGPCANPKNCPADINNDGFVNVNDLLAVINAWGACP